MRFTIGRATSHPMAVLYFESIIDIILCYIIITINYHSHGSEYIILTKMEWNWKWQTNNISDQQIIYLSNKCNENV